MLLAMGRAQGVEGGCSPAGAIEGSGRSQGALCAFQGSPRASPGA